MTARLWTVVLAAAWFLAGVGTGHLLSAPRADESPMARYADRFAETFELDDYRRRTLIQVLDDREARRDEIVHRHQSTTAEPELRALDRQIKQTIRDRILPPKQRQRYDRLNQPVVLQ